MESTHGGHNLSTTQTQLLGRHELLLLCTTISLEDTRPTTTWSQSLEGPLSRSHFSEPLPTRWRVCGLDRANPKLLVGSNFWTLKHSQNEYIRNIFNSRSIQLYLATAPQFGELLCSGRQKLCNLIVVLLIQLSSPVRFIQLLHKGELKSLKCALNPVSHQTLAKMKYCLAPLRLNSQMCPTFFSSDPFYDQDHFSNQNLQHD